ncbi:MAG: hypothetical protein JW737_00920 [Acidobacteria bacterium]|nr:hypothetical protein [Acidobacteriota bacterium]
MKIDKYQFGKMVIDGNAYTSDLIIYPDKVESSWWRKQGHLLQPEDIEDVFVLKPELIIIGTGFFGLMKVSDEVINKVKKEYIELVMGKSGKAVKIFNGMADDKKTIAMFHLTC